MKWKIQIGSFLFFAILISLIGLSSCNQSGNNIANSNDDTLKGKITLSGAFALYPLAVKWAEEFQKLHPKVTVNVSAGGAGKGRTLSQRWLTLACIQNR